MAERINAVKTSFFGKGAITLLGPELRRMGVARALVVTDRFLYESGAAARVGEVLSQAGVEYAVFYRVQPNPTVQVVEDCAAAIRELSAQLLVALGGGSARGGRLARPDYDEVCRRFLADQADFSRERLALLPGLRSIDANRPPEDCLAQFLALYQKGE